MSAATGSTYRTCQDVHAKETKLRQRVAAATFSCTALACLQDTPSLQDRKATASHRFASSCTACRQVANHASLSAANAVPSAPLCPTTKLDKAVLMQDITGNITRQQSLTWRSFRMSLVQSIQLLQAAFKEDFCHSCTAAARRARLACSMQHSRQLVHHPCHGMRVPGRALPKPQARGPNSVSNRLPHKAASRCTAWFLLQG